MGTQQCRQAHWEPRQYSRREGEAETGESKKEHGRHTAQATSRMDEAQVVEALARHQTYTWAPGRDDKEEEGHPPSSKARKGSKEKPAPPRLHYCSSNWCSLLPLPQGDHPPLQGTRWFDQLIGLAIEYYFKRGTKSASSPTNLTLQY